MPSTESVTEWLERLKQGDSLAAQKLWERYVGQLVRLAARQLGGTPRRAADEEDVVVDAFASFCRGAEAGRFAKLDDRDDLWQVLIMLTERKAIDQIRRENAQKRGGGEVRGGSALEPGGSTAPRPPGVEQIVDREPTPEFAVLLAEQLEQVLGNLGDDTLRQIALDKLDGYTNKEIAQRLGSALRGVERGLQLIRRIWSEEQQE